MRIVVLAALAASLLNGADTFQIFGRTWTVPAAGDWKVDAGTLHLNSKRGPLPGPRRPIQFALTSVPAYEQLTIEADVMPLERSLLIAFAYRDEAHFDYAHLSIDTGAVQPVHNGIFHVYGGERVRVSSERGPAAFAASGHWYHVKLTHNVSTGSVDVEVDGKAIPALHAVELALGAGSIGLGSFDETGAFRNVKITSR